MIFDHTHLSCIYLFSRREVCKEREGEREYFRLRAYVGSLSLEVEGIKAIINLTKKEKKEEDGRIID